MRRFALFTLAVGTLLGSVALLIAHNNIVAWQTFTMPEGGASILMPGAAVQESADGATVPTVMYGVRTPAYFCSIARLQLPAAVEPGDASARLDAIRDGMLELVDGRVQREQPLRLDGQYPGREVVYDSPARHAYGRVRLYLVGASLYHVQITAARPDWERAEFERYFASFRLAP